MDIGLEYSETPSSRLAVQKFEELAEDFCSEMNRVGFRLIPTYNQYKKFESLSHQLQQRILKALISYRVVLSSAHSQGINLAHSRSTAWAAIRELGLRPPSNLFEHLEEGDFFEIYTPEHIQIFRSLNFFYLTSYSLEDIFSYAWDELYSRSEVVTKEMFDSVSKVMNGERQGLVKTDFPLHIVIDKFSPGKEWSLIRHKLFAPLISSNQEIFVFNVFTVVDRKEKSNELVKYFEDQTL
jgi:hypothetical protein